MISVEMPRPGIELAAAAELDDRLAHGLAALGDGLDLEIIQLVMAAEDRFDGQEGRVDRPSPRLTPESVWPFFVSFICAEALMVLPVLMT